MSEVLDAKHSPSPGAHSSSNWEPDIWELWHGLSKLCSAVLCFACAVSFLWLKLTKCALETFVTTSKSGRDHLELTLLFPGRIPSVWAFERRAGGGLGRESASFSPSHSSSEAGEGKQEENICMFSVGN